MVIPVSCRRCRSWSRCSPPFTPGAGTAGAAVGVVAIGGLIGELTCARLGPDLLQRWYLLIGWLLAAAIPGGLSRATAPTWSRWSSARSTPSAPSRRPLGAVPTRNACASPVNCTTRSRTASRSSRCTPELPCTWPASGIEPVPEALVAIERASGDAMRELRATLEVLRGDQRPPGGLDSIAALVDGVRAAGLSGAGDCGRRAAATAGRGGPDRVSHRPGGTDQRGPACRCRHGVGPARVRREGLIVDALTTTGAAAAEVVPGIGLSGMRERVIALGGSLRAGPRAGGGFSVRAELPLAAPPGGPA